MDPINKNISLNLRLLRQERGWSLDKTSLETKVSKAMLGQIEREESSPTISTLWKIASGFHIPFSSFLQKPLEQDSDIAMNQMENNIRVKPLFAFDPELKCEVFIIELLPSHEHLATPHEKGIIEHVIVTEGSIEVLAKGSWHTLQKGEGLRFDAHQPHGYRNLTTQTACFHNIIHYPDHSKKSTSKL